MEVRWHTGKGFPRTILDALEELRVCVRPRFPDEPRHGERRSRATGRGVHTTFGACTFTGLGTIAEELGENRGHRT